MFSKVLLTFRYLVSVKGYHSVPANSFPARMGCASSDRFTVTLTEAEYAGGVSLAEFHAAFLCSPVFQMELWILSKVLQREDFDAVTIQPRHLRDVALGERSRVGPWTAWAVDGNRTRAVSSTTTTTSTATTPSTSSSSSSNNKPACQIMQCRIHNKPFCETWWAVELEEEPAVAPALSVVVRHPQLVFGTALIPSNDENNESSSMSFRRLLTKAMTPLHRLYSRLLLASAKATLVVEGQKRER